VIRFSSHLSMQFTALPLLERPAAARAAGFDLVETWWPGADAAAWADAVQQAGVGVACLNADGGDLAAGERGFLNVAQRYEQTLASFAEALALAQRVDAGAINVLAGRRVPDVPLARQWDVAVSTLRELAGDVAIVVEALNEHDVPGSLVPTPRRAVELVEAVGSDSVRLLYDAYHAAMAGSDPVAEVAELAPFVGHVQYADCPGRGAPGTGCVDLNRLVEALDAAGYDGAVGLEYASNDRETVRAR